MPEIIILDLSWWQLQYFLFSPLQIGTDPKMIQFGVAQAPTP